MFEKKITFFIHFGKPYSKLGVDGFKVVQGLNIEIRMLCTNAKKHFIK